MTKDLMLAVLNQAETGEEILEALDNYDSVVLEYHTESVETEGEVTLTDADGVVTSV